MSYPFNTVNYPYNAYCIFNIKYKGRNTARILYCGREITNSSGYSITQRFIRVQYIERNDVSSTTWRNNSSTPSSDDYIIPLEYNDGYNSYHFWSFNMTRDRWYIYLDGNLVLTSSVYSTTNFNFGITELKLEQEHLNLNDGNTNRYQFADIYYFKRYLTTDEILSLSRYHMSQLNNTLRVYSTLEVDKIICNSILDYDYTEKKFKKLTYEISQTSNLQKELDGKEPVIDYLTANRVVVSDANAKLASSTITAQGLKDVCDVVNGTEHTKNFNPIANWISTNFGSQILAWVNGFSGLLALGISVLVGFNSMLGLAYAIYIARSAIQKSFVDFTDCDLTIYDTSLTDYSAGKMRISDTYNNSNIVFRRDYQQGYPDNIKNINTGKVKIGNVDNYESDANFQVIGGNTKVGDKIIVQKSLTYGSGYIYDTTSRLELESGIFGGTDINTSITATGLNHNYANNLTLNADGILQFQTYNSGTSAFTPKLTIVNNGRIGIGTTDPIDTFHIHRTGDNAVSLRLTNDTTSIGTGSDGVLVQLEPTTNNLLIYNYETAGIKLATDGFQRLYIDSSGNVGIGLTTTLTNKLEVAGTVKCSQLIDTGLSASSCVLTDVNKQLVSSTLLPVANGGTNKGTMTAYTLLGCGTTANQYDEISLGNGLSMSTTSPFTLSSTAYSGADTRFTTVNTNDIYLTNTIGNIGIGTNNPLEELHLHKSTSPAVDTRVRFTNINTLTNGNPTISDGSIIGIDATANLEIRNYENLPIIFYTNNTEKVRIQADGGVGIGTNSTGTNKLQVNGTIAGTTLTGAYNPSSLSSAVPVNKGGTNLTTIPASKLLYTTALDIIGNLGIGTGLQVSGTDLRAIGYLGADTRFTTVNTNDIYLTTTTGVVGIGTNAPASSYQLHLHNATTTLNAGLTMRIGTATSGADMFLQGPTSDLILYNRLAGGIRLGTNNTQRMYINSAGNVGIGTAIPDTSYSFHIHNPTASGRSGITMRNGTATTGFDAYLQETTNDVILWNRLNTNMRFATNNLERMRILADGNVGIGTGSSTYKLYVNGTSKVENDLTVGGAIYSINSKQIHLGAANSVLSFDDQTTYRRIQTYGNIPLSINPLYNSVGIGKTDPNDVLDVRGNIRCSDGNIAIVNSAPYDHFRMTHDGTAIYFDVGGAETGIIFRIDATSVGYPASTYTERMRITQAGLVGIDNTDPKGTLSLGNVSSGNSDGNIVFAKSSGGVGGSNRYIKMGYNSAYDFSIGDFGNNATSGTWVNAFRMHYLAPADSFVINSTGGTTVKNTFTMSDSTSYAGVLTLNGYMVLNQGNGDSRYIEFNRTSTVRWRLYAGVADGNSEGNFNFNIYQSSSATWFICAYIEDDRSWGVQMNFTGQHRCYSEDKTIYSSNYNGFLVSCTGKYKNISSKYGKNNIKQNITTNDALPYIELTNKAYDPCVYGILTDRTDDEEGKYRSGAFVSNWKKDVADDRCVVNGLGEGSLWVCNYNGILHNGDYLCSSYLEGLAMKQDDDLVHNYTVAKITMDCDFNPQLIPVEVIKQEEYSYWGTSNIECNGSNYDIPILCYTTSNIVDDNGYPIYEYKLDESSNIVYDYEYEVKSVMYNNIEYKMAFVGACYKCS